MNTESTKEDLYIDELEFEAAMCDVLPVPSIDQVDETLLGSESWVFEELRIASPITTRDGISHSLDIAIAAKDGLKVINRNKRRGEDLLDEEEFKTILKRFKYDENDDGNIDESTELANNDGTIIRCLLFGYTRLPTYEKKELLERTIKKTLRYFDARFASVVENRPIYTKLLVEMMYAAKIAKLDSVMEIASSHLQDLELKEEDKYRLMGSPKALWKFEYQMDQNTNPNLWDETWDKNEPRHCKMMNNSSFLYNINSQLKYGWMMIELGITTAEESDDFLAIVENATQYLAEYEESQGLSRHCFSNLVRLIETTVACITNCFTVRPPCLPHLLSICKSLHKKVPKSQTVGLDLLRASSTLEEVIRAFDFKYNETRTSTRHLCFASIECVNLSELSEFSLAIDRSISRCCKFQPRDEGEKSLIVDVAIGQLRSAPEKEEVSLLQFPPHNENALIL
jgi:hypothetical protein